MFGGKLGENMEFIEDLKCGFLILKLKISVYIRFFSSALIGF